MEKNDFDIIELNPCRMINLKSFNFDKSTCYAIVKEVIDNHRNGFYLENEKGMFIPLLSARKFASAWLKANIGDKQKIETFITTSEKRKISLNKEDIETYDFLKKLYEIYPNGFYVDTLSNDKNFTFLSNYNNRLIGCFLDKIKNKTFNDLILTNNKNPLSKTHVSKKWKVRKIE